MAEKKVPRVLAMWAERLPEINKMRAEGKTGEEIAAHFSTPKAAYAKTIQRLTMAGYSIEPSIAAIRTKDGGLEERFKDILPLMEKGLFAHQIAEVLGRTRPAVQKDIEKAATTEQRAAWANTRGPSRSSKTKKKSAAPRPKNKPGCKPSARKPSVTHEVHFNADQVQRLKSLVATGADLDHIRTEMGFSPEASSAYVKAQCSFYISAKEWAEGWKSRKREHLVERAEAKERMIEARTGRRNHATNHPAMEPGGIAWAAIWNGNPPPYPQHLVTGVFS